MLEILLLE